MSLKYYTDMKYVTLSNPLRQANIKTENQSMVFSDSIWKDCTETVISTGAYIIFYLVGKIYDCTHVLGPVSQSSAEI